MSDPILQYWAGYDEADPLWLRPTRTITARQPDGQVYTCTFPEELDIGQVLPHADVLLHDGDVD